MQRRHLIGWAIILTCLATPIVWALTASFSDTIWQAPTIKADNYYLGSTDITSKLSGLAYPEETTSYIFYKDGGTYYAKNGHTGAVTSSASAVTLINSITVSGNVAITLKNGIYFFTSPIILSGKSSITIRGEEMGAFESFTQGTILTYSGGATTAFIDARECRSICLEELKVKNYGSASIGVYLGGATNSATKTKGIRFTNVVIDGFEYGLKGATFGPDDSTYNQCYIGNNTIANVDNLSSMSVFTGGTLYTSPIGVRVGRAPGASADAGMTFLGTIWSSCDICIDVVSNQSINMLTFTSCWFEACSTMILRTTQSQAGIFIGTILFDNCIGVVSGSIYMDLSGRNIQLEWRNGELYPTTTVATDIITDGVGGTYQKLSIYPIAGAEYIYYNDTNGGLKGIHAASFILFNDLNGYTNVAFQNATWQSGLMALKAPINGLSCVKITINYRWNPGSAGGGVALLWSGVKYGISEPGVNGARVDTIDITNAMRTLFSVGGDLGFQMHGDGVTAPIIYYVEVIYEW